MTLRPSLSSGDVFSAMREQIEMVKALPPVPRAILVNHGVPYGRIFRQWDTDGVLWVWANPGEVADLPHKRRRAGDPLPLFGIPVVYR